MAVERWTRSGSLAHRRQLRLLTRPEPFTHHRPAPDDGDFINFDEQDRRRSPWSTMSTPAKRLQALETHLADIRCDTCRAWPALVILFDDVPLEHPATCPDSGQNCTPSNIIVFREREDGPQ